MAISFGRRGSGGGEGSSRVGFVSNKQSSTHFEVGNHDTNFTNPNFTTSPSWQLTLKEGGKGEIVYSYQIILTNATGVSNVRYSAKLQVAGKDSLSAVPVNNDFVDVEILPENNHYIHDELITYDGESPIQYTLSGTIPFALSDLPSSITDNEYLRFRVPIKISSDGSPTAEADNGYIAFKSFGVGAGSTDINGANIQDGTVTNAELAPNSVSTIKLQDGSVTHPKLAPDAVEADNIKDGAVTHDKLGTSAVETDNISAGAVNDNALGADSVINIKIQDGAVTNPKLGLEAVETNKIKNGAVTPVKLSGVNVAGATAGQILELNSAKTGLTFVDKPSGGGGGGVPANDSITHAMLKQNIIENDNMADDSVGANELIDDSVGNAAMADDAITPAEVAGITPGSSNAGAVLALDTTNGTSFITRPYNTGGGGGSSSFADITGINPTTKGGTGFNATDISDLRNKLGIQSSAGDAVIPYSTNLATQKDGTLERVNSSTSTIPTGLADGISVRINNDQWVINLEDGKQWKRNLTDTPGTWGTSTNVTLTSVSTIADLNAIPEGGARMMSSGNFRPQYTDGVYADKVIIGRHGEHDDDHDDELIAMDRHNFWWAERPAADDTSITWHWEGTSIIPPGLYYTGGETDEEHIPVGSVAVLGGKTGIDGEEYINVMVGHSYDSSTQTSTYTGYWIDDDASKTTKATTNTRGYVQGTWSRVELDSDGIADEAIGAAKINNEIIITDTSKNEPVFLGIVPSIDDLTFSDYTFRVGTSPGTGEVSWYASQRGLRIAHAVGHDHIDKLLQPDVELQVRKDSSNYIRGVFESITVIPGGGGATQAVFRQEGLQVVGTISAGDTVSIVGHKAVFTKLEQIPTINIADDAVTQAKIGPGAVGNTELADDAVTAPKIEGIDITDSNAGGKVIAVKSDRSGLELVTQTGGGGGGTPPDDSITTAKLANNSVTIPDKVASVLTALTGTYAFQGYNQVSEPTAGQIGASSISNGRSQIQFQLRTTDTAAKAHFAATGFHTNNEIVTLTNADRSKYLAIKADTRNQVSDDFGITGDVIANAGTFTTNESVTILYGQRYGSLRINAVGKLVVDNSPSILGLTDLGATEAGNVVTLDDAGNGFDSVDRYLLPRSVKPAISKSRSYTVVTGSTADGQYAQNSGIPTFGTTDNGADATFLANLDTAARAGDGTTILIVKDASNYISFRSTGAITQGSNLSLFSSVSNYSTIGTISSGDTVQVYLEPANANQIIQFDAIGENPQLVDLPSGGGGGSSGVIKQTLLMRQEHGGNGRELTVSSTSVRSIIGGTGSGSQQTGTWTMASKSSDWIRFSGGGLCYFGEIAAQPVIADFAVWYRWRDASAGQSFQNWVIGNSRVEEVPLGTDKLMVVKLFAGGGITLNGTTIPANAGGNVTNYSSVTSANAYESHVDMAVGSGNKFVKLSELNSGLTDGMEVQFTLAFMRQTANPTSGAYTSYTARRFFLTCDVMDGSNVQANY